MAVLLLTFISAKKMLRIFGKNIFRPYMNHDMKQLPDPNESNKKLITLSNMSTLRTSATL